MDPDPLIAEHAAWAVERIRTRHGAGGSSVEPTLSS
jgi:hypothetical protein